MKTERTLTIRYMGSDDHRRFVIQRGDGRFWSDEDWSPALEDATLFASHKVAQEVCGKIYNNEYGGKPTRSFRCTVEVNVVGDDVSEVSREMLLQFLYDAVRIDVATADYGDGPLDNTLVQARLVLKSLREQK
jgi:hypothetical protein